MTKLVHEACDPRITKLYPKSDQIPDKHYKLIIDLYVTHLNIWIGSSEELKVKFADWQINSNWVACVSKSPDSSHFNLLMFDDNDITYSSIAHEVHHIVFYVLDRIGCPLIETTVEPHAYLYGYIFRNVVGVVQHHLATKNKKRTKKNGRSSTRKS